MPTHTERRSLQGHLTGRTWRFSKYTWSMLWAEEATTGLRAASLSISTSLPSVTATAASFWCCWYMRPTLSNLMEASGDALPAASGQNVLF